MFFSLLCICARFMGPRRVIFILFAVSVEDIAPKLERRGCQHGRHKMGRTHTDLEPTMLWRGWWCAFG